MGTPNRSIRRRIFRSYINQMFHVEHYKPKTMKIKNIEDLLTTRNIPSGDLPEIFKMYIRHIRLRGFRTGILGEESDNKILAEHIWPRLERNWESIDAGTKKKFLKGLPALKEWANKQKKYYRENPRTTATTVKISLQTLKKLTLITKYSEGITVSSLIAQMVEDGLAEWEGRLKKWEKSSTSHDAEES